MFVKKSFVQSKENETYATHALAFELVGAMFSVVPQEKKNAKLQFPPCYALSAHLEHFAKV